ncbi:MAG: carbohydrate kinase family protein [Opitutaceae bacterium]|nr:carbohydrate kinase family protein [Opitutaceae bacterium]
MKELPREGQLLAIEAMPVKAGGCAANVAIDLAKQGLAVDVVGCLGRDPSADVILACLGEHNVGCAQVVRVDRHPTSKTTILLVAGEDRRYIHVFGANRAFTIRHIKRDWLKSLNVFYLGGLCALPGIEMAELQELLEFCRRQKITTVVDVVVPQSWTGIEALKPLLPHIDYFLPNNDEARLITGRTDTLDQLRAFRTAGANTVVITQGKAGAIATKGGEYWQCGVFPITSVDPSGSGDAFSAGIITGILRGLDMPQILRYASALGASATRAIGTTDGVFTAVEAEAFVASRLLPVASGAL